MKMRILLTCTLTIDKYSKQAVIERLEAWQSTGDDLVEYLKNHMTHHMTAAGHHNHDITLTRKSRSACVPENFGISGSVILWT